MESPPFNQTQQPFLVFHIISSIYHLVAMVFVKPDSSNQLQLTFNILFGRFTYNIYEQKRLLLTEYEWIQ